MNKYCIFWLCLAPFCGSVLADEAILGSLLKARYAMILKEFDQALNWVHEAKRLEPLSSDAAYLHVEIMLDQMKYRGVPSSDFEQSLLDELQLGIGKFPRDYRFHMTLGRVLTASQRWQRFAQFDDPGVYLRQSLRLMQGQTREVSRDLIDTQYQLGLWYFANNQMFEAAQALKAVCRLDPTMSWAFYYAGQACEKSGEYNSALAFFEKYQKLGLRDIGKERRPLKLKTAILRTLLVPSTTHLQHLLFAIQDEGPDPKIYYEVALRFYRMADLDTSIKILEQLFAKHEFSPHALNLHFRIQMERHEYQTVVDEVLQALKKQPQARIQRILVDYGAEAALLGGRSEALATLVRDYANIPGAEFRLMLFSAFQDVMANEDSEAWNRFINSDLNSDFADFLKQEAKNKGVRGTVLENISQFYQARKDWEGALGFLKAHMDRNHPPVDLWDDLADGNALANKWEKAFYWYQQILKREPNRADMLNNYGYFLTNKGRDLDRAKVMIKKAVRLEPQTSAYLDSLGWVYYKMGNLMEAEHYLLLALGLEPEDPEKLDHFGDIQFALGSKERARAAWSQALSLIQDQSYNLSRQRIKNLVLKLDPMQKNTEQGMP